MYILLLVIFILFYLCLYSNSLLYPSQIKNKGGFYSCTFTPYTDTSYMITGINRNNIIDSENDIRDVIMQRYL